MIDKLRNRRMRGRAAALLAATAAIIGLATTPVEAQQNPIKIGYGMSLTGGLAVNGKAAIIAHQAWAAIRSAGLVELLNGRGPFTIFAPDDKAFAKISEADLEDILRTNQTLTSVLTHHIVEGNISSADFKNGMKVTSEEGGILTFNISSKGLMVSNANITKADIVANNGIIHIIDTVLGYKALATQPQTSGDWLDKGIALNDMGKNNEALKALEMAIEKDPQLAEAWYEKGLILEILGRKKEAQAAFAKLMILCG